MKNLENMEWRAFLKIIRPRKTDYEKLRFFMQNISMHAEVSMGVHLSRFDNNIFKENVTNMTKRR